MRGDVGLSKPVPEVFMTGGLAGMLGSSAGEVAANGHVDAVHAQAAASYQRHRIAAANTRSVPSGAVSVCCTACTTRSLLPACMMQEAARLGYACPPPPACAIAGCTVLTAAVRPHAGE
mgnify:CR=1 FL=1